MDTAGGLSGLVRSFELALVVEGLRPSTVRMQPSRLAVASLAAAILVLLLGACSSGGPALGYQADVGLTRGQRWELASRLRTRGS